MAENGHRDPVKLPRGDLKQLETPFEVQAIRKDKQGNVVRRSETLDTYAEAEVEKYVAKQDAELERTLQTQGGFEVGLETITVQEVLEKFPAEHYKCLASFKEVGFRIPYLVDWLEEAGNFGNSTRKTSKSSKLAALLLASSGLVRHRGVAALTKVLGLEDAKKFLNEVRELKHLDDIFK